MRKLILTTSLLIFGFLSSYAQTVSFGVKAGANFANLYGDLDDASMKIGFHVGGVAEIMINDKFGVQPEILFSDQGAKEDFEGVDISYNLSYINVPIMAKYYATENLSLEAGPQIGFLVDSKVKAKYEGDSATTDLEDISTLDFGFNFGLGYKLNNGLNFGARYNLGLSNVYDGEGSDDEKINNGVIQVSVGFMF
ncbi:PorT family protein [Mangrovimonas sp. AS39]|uniref:porin family protein n=1 Tax=Mangrovimonas futianensis TaxID=2895523 RepID=UPI001E507390|nr:porin family protein [Mangrovimonas futianensis]MCF1192823.1 PorT family protein [Mangrovimonas futianensis]MCF1196575.1 PorT family protein [Mangrovimonas futianensis]